MCGLCSDGWRFETTKLGGPDAGQVTGLLHPIGAEFEENYSRPSVGSLQLAAQDPSAEDVFPDTGLYISQVLPDGTRKGRFGGYIDRNNGVGGGALPVALKSIDFFLYERLFAGPNTPYELNGQLNCFAPWIGTMNFSILKPIGFEVYQNPFYFSGFYPQSKSSLPVFLVNKIAKGNLEGGDITGLPTLNARIGEPSQVYTNCPEFLLPFQLWWDIKNIGQMIEEIVSAEDGPKYQLEHTFDNGYWSTEMVFADTVGIERDYILKSDREGWQYGLEVDGSEKASRLYAIGAGEEWSTLYSIAYDAGRDPDYPERQVTVAWKDQINPATLDVQARGYVADHRDPTAVPSMTVVGLPGYDPDAPGYNPQVGFPPPEICRPGDSFGVDIGYGAITVRDIRVKNLGVAWSLKEGEPVERTIAMQPLERPALSIRTQVPAKPPEGQLPVQQGGGAVTADPWPTPGVLSNINVPTLTEISGIEVSRANPGYMWAMDDELDNPQVVLVNMKNGRQAASFTPNPGVSGGNVGDPEAIRLSKVTGQLVLADTGDNDLNRPTSGPDQPHLLALPEPKGAGSKGLLTATRYPIAFPDGERINCETLLIHPTTDWVYLVSKEATRARVFSFGPLSAMSTVNNVGSLVATLNMPLVADGTHSATGAFMLFRTAKVTQTYVLKSNWRYAGAIPTPAMAKSEAIAVVNSCAFVTTTEGIRPPLYQVLISKAFGATCASPTGPSGDGGTPTNPSATVPGQLIDMSNWKLQLPI